MAHWKLYYHIVWSTKNRTPMIDERRAQLLNDSMRLTCLDLDVLQYEIGVMPDHVHCFVALPPTVAVASFVHRVKGGSSHAIRSTESNKTFEWQREYGAYSIHENQIPKLLDYIRNQPEHHATNNLHSNLEITERPHQKPISPIQ